MNFIQSFNRTMEYIESVLEESVEERQITLLSGYSYGMFRRLFSILTGMTLSEYMRNRKLTKAAEELQNHRGKVLDIAIKYGYESSNSFGAAFKQFHGFTPSEVKKGKPFQRMMPIQLAISVKGGRKMNVWLQHRTKFFVGGLNAKGIDTKLCSQVWERLFARYKMEDFLSIGEGQAVGVCHNVESPNRLDYMAGYIIEDIQKAKDLGMDILAVEEADYAVVQLKGKIPDCIHEGWKYVMEVYFPEQGYVHSGKPDFEYYLKGEMNSSEYEMELWIPVVKSN